MQKKPDGHIKFYTKNEFVALASQVGLTLESEFITQIRFPRKEAENYNTLLEDCEPEVLNSYEITLQKDEIYITEQVLNLSFISSPML